MVNDLLLASGEPPVLCIAIYPNTEHAGVKGHRLVVNNGTSYQSVTVQSIERIKELLCEKVDIALSNIGEAYLEGVS